MWRPTLPSFVLHACGCTQTPLPTPSFPQEKISQICEMFLQPKHIPNSVYSPCFSSVAKSFMMLSGHSLSRSWSFPHPLLTPPSLIVWFKSRKVVSLLASSAFLELKLLAKWVKNLSNIVFLPSKPSRWCPHGWRPPPLLYVTSVPVLWSLLPNHLPLPGLVVWSALPRRSMYIDIYHHHFFSSLRSAFTLEFITYKTDIMIFVMYMAPYFEQIFFFWMNFFPFGQRLFLIIALILKSYYLFSGYSVPHSILGH